MKRFTKFCRASVVSEVIMKLRCGQGAILTYLQVSKSKYR